MGNRSKLVRMHIQNLGCIGPEGLTVELDNILCIVGRNNSGKSTVLRAYELAVSGSKLKPEDVCAWAGGGNPVVEIYAHIPPGTPNIDEKWKDVDGDLRIVRSRWEWGPDGTSKRSTWDPSAQEYASNGKAAGLDTVFNSRLPQPFRIGFYDNPAEEQKKLLKLIIDPISSKFAADLSDSKTILSQKYSEFRDEIGAFISQAQAAINLVEKDILSDFSKIFPEHQPSIHIGTDVLNIKKATEQILAGSKLNIVYGDHDVSMDQQGTGSQRALFWSILRARSKIEKAVGTGRKAKGTKKAASLPPPASEEDDQAFFPGYMLLIDEP